MANTVVCSLLLFLSFAIFVNCDVDDITTSRHLRLIHVEIDMLTSLLTKKELARRQLQHCVTSLENRVNDSIGLNQNDEINICKLRSTLHELKVLTEKEKELYQIIIEKMRALFPDRLLLRGPRNTAEMLVELDNILSRFTDVFADPEMDDVSAECGSTPCFEAATPAPQLQTTLDLCGNNQGCEVSAFSVTEDNEVIGILGNDVVLFSGQDGSRLATYSFEFTPENMAYQDHGTFFVEYDQNDREIYRYNTTSRQLTLLMSISNGFSSYGIDYLDGKLFIGGKYGGGMHVYFLGESRVVQIYTYITNYDQYHSVLMCPTELGSKYGLFTGRIVRNALVLITSSGERICSISSIHEYTSIHCGVVGRDGTFYLPGDGEIVRYNNRCEPTGAFPVPDTERYITRMDLQNGKLYVHQQNGQISIYQI